MSLNLLGKGDIQKTSKLIRTVDGSQVVLIHQGKRVIETRYGMVTLNNVHYAGGLEFSLMSVPVMVSKGVTLNVEKGKASIRKGDIIVPLVKRDRLWALQTGTGEFKIVSLRMDGD